MPTLSKEDWRNIRSSINRFNSVLLLIDGHKIKISLMDSISEMKLYYMIIIDGEINLDINQKLKEKFWFESTRRMYKRKAFKGLRKQTLKQLKIDPNAKYYYHSPDFPSFRSLKSVLSKNESIEILKGVTIDQ